MAVDGRGSSGLADSLSSRQRRGRAARRFGGRFGSAVAARLNCISRISASDEEAALACFAALRRFLRPWKS